MNSIRYLLPAAALAALSCRAARAGETPETGVPVTVPAGYSSDVRMDARFDARGNPRVADPVLVPVAPCAAPCGPCGVAPAGFEAPFGGPELWPPGAFQDVGSYGAIADRRYQPRETIWNTPEEFVTPVGTSGDHGVAYIPFWARNVLRVGRAQFFPFAEVQGIYHSNYFGDSDDEVDVFEVATTAGFLGEYMFGGGRTNLQFGGRATWHTFDDEVDDEWTWVGGASIETQLTCNITLAGGFEYERAICPVNSSTTLFRGRGDKDHGHDDEHGKEHGKDGHGKDGKDHDTKDGVIRRRHDRGQEEVESWRFFGAARWDNFLLCGLRLDVGGRFSMVEETSGIAGYDYDETSLFGRLSYAICRHDTFLYAQYGYEWRDVNDPYADLDEAHEVRVGVNGVLPFGSRTRRVVGDAYVGYRMEEYEGGAFGGDDDVDAVIAGVDLTWYASPYASFFLGYERTNTFSTVANYNELDQVDAGMTYNLTQDLMARVAGSWTRLAPEGGDDSHRVAVGAGLRWTVMRGVDLTVDYEYSHRFEGAGLDEADGHRVAAGATIYLR